MRSAVGRAEQDLREGDDEHVLALAISDGDYDAAQCLRRVLASQAESTVDPQPIWFALAVGWVMAGHPEPGRNSTPPSASTEDAIESLWCEFDHPEELAFAIGWMPSEDEPAGRPSVRGLWERAQQARRERKEPAPSFWERVEPDVQRWVAERFEELAASYGPAV